MPTKYGATHVMVVNLFCRRRVIVEEKNEGEDTWKV